MVFHVLEKAEPPKFICRFVRKIDCNSITQRRICRENQGIISHGQERQTRLPGERLLVRTMAFDPIFRWLENTMIPRNPATPDFLQPVPCAYADDFAVGLRPFDG